MKEIAKLAIFLAVVAMLAAAVLSLTYLFTYEKIKEQEALEIQNALKVAYPEADNFVKKDGLFVANSGRRFLGVVYKVASKGYSGDIEMLVGISRDGKVKGVEIVKIAETPGLGLNAANQDFLSQFIDRDVRSPLVPKEDIEALSGATITTTAVCDGVKKALQKNVERRSR
jgi:electron transport complex protein RnfG